VNAASVLVGTGARGCLQHGANLFIYHIVMGSKAVADVFAVVGYLARLSSCSNSFRQMTGIAIPAGCVTRWGSFAAGARAVYDLRSALATYSESEMAPEGFISRFAILQGAGRGGDVASGFKILHDVALLLQPFVTLALDSEGERRPSSSMVIPLLCAAKKSADRFFLEAGSAVPGTVLCKDLFAELEPTYKLLYDKYLLKFAKDPVMQCATLIDPRNRGGLGLPADVTAMCGAALRAKMEAKYNEIRQHNPAPAAAAADAAGADEAHLAALGLPRAPLAGPIGVPGSVVQDEYVQFLTDAVKGSLPLSPASSNFSLKIYKKYPIIQAVARDVLRVPAGEAPSERVFSLAGRLQTAGRARLSPKRLAVLTYLNHNGKNKKK
jgi:hypothetical protein